MTTPPSPTQPHYASLQAGRAVAAIGVLLFHVWLMARDHLNWNFIGTIVSHGARGVDFFFVLSGFIILHVNRSSLGVPADAPRYFYRRLVRIYPIFLVITLVKLGYMLLGGGGVPLHKTSLSFFLCSTLLIPQPQWPFVAVSWTLTFEMFFYSTFLLFILFGLRFRWWLVAHAAACLILNIPGMPPLEFPVSFFFSTQILDFYLGCVAAYLCAQKRISAPLAYGLVSGGVGLLYVAYRFDAELQAALVMLGPPVWGIAFFLIITGVANLDHQKRLPIPRWLAYLGDASYSTYLVHNNVILIGGALIARHLSQVANHLNLVLFALAGMSLLAGVICYQFIEKPLVRWFQRRGPQRTRRAPPASMLAPAGP
jgi:peptidoglycan/LPS O-acetylase OafA/YrhL